MPLEVMTIPISVIPKCQPVNFSEFFSTLFSNTFNFQFLWCERKSSTLHKATTDIIVLHL